MTVLLIAAGVWLLMPTGSRRRIPLATRSRALPMTDFAAAFAGLGSALFVGGLAGVAVGVLVGFGARWGLSRLSTEDHKAQRDALLRQAPDAVDCLASCLAAGAPLWSAMRVVADAFGEPMAGVLSRAVDRHELGSTAADTFAEFVGPLAPLGRVLVRSSESGGALADALVACADRMRQERGTQLEVKANEVGVKVVAPLTLCFLPAFMLLAIVPIVGSLASSLVPSF